MTRRPGTPRGTDNTNQRGSSADRAARKRWLLKQFGDGTQAPCALQLAPDCLRTVTFATVTVDRYPVPGCQGGRYTRDNIRPACGPCNSLHGCSLRRATAA